MAIELTPDDKGQASLTFGEVIRQTRNNFPETKYRPKVYLDTPQYHLYGINPSPHSIWVTADGIGTKPELAERLYSLDGNPAHFEGLAYDTFAMVESDEARWGRFLVGIANILDTNNVDQEIITALAKGAKNACDEGGFPLLNGETAELGYRTSGYGNSRINWNAVGVSIVVPDKLVLGQDLEPGQIIVGLPERSIRSNGLSKARAILEAAYLHSRKSPSKESYIQSQLSATTDHLNHLMGHNFLEQVQLPWHEQFSDITKELLKPSTLYGHFVNNALGGVDGEKWIDITAMAHISGGGIPEKVKRMLEPKGLGAFIDERVFPIPKSINMLMDLAKTLPDEGASLIDDRRACENWNMGIGFILVVKTQEDAHHLFALSQHTGRPAFQIGEITDRREIEFRGHTWTY